MYIFQKLFHQSINANNLNKLAASKQKSKNTIFKVFKDMGDWFWANKMLSFLIPYAGCSFVYFMLPYHIRRPEILARNRLEKRIT